MEKKTTAKVKAEAAKSVVKEAAVEKAPAKTATKTTEKKAPAKKPAAKKEAVKKETVKEEVKKEEVTPEIFVQFANREAVLADVVEKVKKQFADEGHKVSGIKTLQIYLKPEDYSAYYVINGKNVGRVDLF